MSASVDRQSSPDQESVPSTTGISPEAAQAVLGTLDREVARHLALTLGHDDSNFAPEYLSRALATSVRDRLADDTRSSRCE
jgi:hypothetical protein